MTLFFDTSALVKFFHIENGTVAVTNLISDKNNSIIISEIAIIEFISAIYKKFRENEINRSELKKAIDSFYFAIEDFTIEPFISVVRNESVRIISEYGHQNTIRSLDSLHLATYHLIADKNSAFVCCDKNLVLASKFFKNKTINPLD